MPQESYSERKLRQMGFSSDGSAKRLQFRLYFPRPPYSNVDYKAAKTKDGYNFVGLVLGHQGATIQKIQRTTGTKIEIHDKNGNLNGDHPAANDPTLHAFILADSKKRLEQAADMIAETLLPTNAKFESFKVAPGGSALLKPKVDRARQQAASPTSATSLDSLTNKSSNSEPITPPPPIPSAWRRSENGVTALHSIKNVASLTATPETETPAANSNPVVKAPSPPPVAHNTFVADGVSPVGGPLRDTHVLSGAGNGVSSGDTWQLTEIADKAEVAESVAGWSMWSVSLPDVCSQIRAASPVTPVQQFQQGGQYPHLHPTYNYTPPYSQPAYASPQLPTPQGRPFYPQEMVVTPPYPGATPHTKSYIAPEQQCYVTPVDEQYVMQQQRTAAAAVQEGSDSDVDHNIAHLVELLKVPLQG